MVTALATGSPVSASVTNIVYALFAYAGNTEKTAVTIINDNIYRSLFKIVYLCDMGKEIERKFLVIGDSYMSLSYEHLELAQGYLSANPDATVRIRVAGTHGYLTVKGRNAGIVRDEWEYVIPVADAWDMLDRLCGQNVVRKTRYKVNHGGLCWEIDVFHGHLDGLKVAEVELCAPDIEVGVLPSFIGREVTGDERYYNSQLISAKELPPCE